MITACQEVGSHPFGGRLASLKRAPKRYPGSHSGGPLLQKRDTLAPSMETSAMCHNMGHPVGDAYRDCEPMTWHRRISMAQIRRWRQRRTWPHSQSDSRNAARPAVELGLILELLASTGGLGSLSRSTSVWSGSMRWFFPAAVMTALEALTMSKAEKISAGRQ